MIGETTTKLIFKDTILQNCKAYANICLFTKKTKKESK